MGNILGAFRFMTRGNQSYAPDREEDFAEKNIGVPCRVVTGNKVAQNVVANIGNILTREEFSFGIAVPRRDFTGGVCPSNVTTGKTHEKYKRFMLEVLSKASGEIPVLIAKSVLSNISQWGSAPRDFELKMMAVVADTLIPSIFGQSTPFEAEEIDLYASGVIEPTAPVLKQLSRMNLDKERQALSSIVAKVKTSERYQQLLDIGKSHGLTEEETTGQLLFTAFFNGVAGTAVNVVGSFARLDSISGEDREELREEALAALKKHGGLTPEALGEMPKIESFVLESLRANPSALLWGFVAPRPTTLKHTTKSGDREVEIKEGELVLASSYWVLRDPAVFDKPEDFVWRRFLGPEGKARRENHIVFMGRLTDTPAPSNYMCAGKEAALALIKSNVAIFNTFFGWELQDPPVWTGTKFLRSAMPDNEVKIKKFWVQHPEDLKDIFPSHADDIIDALA
ncbi:uncharacterized protein LOC144859752 [Branchiostoma floridae x Branchiostoma japonicum]